MGADRARNLDWMEGVRLMGLTRRQLFDAADLAAADHLPTCGRCGDLGEVGQECCEGCGNRLYPYGVTPPRIVQTIEAPKMEKWWRERFTKKELAELTRGFGA